MQEDEKSKELSMEELFGELVKTTEDLLSVEDQYQQLQLGFLRLQADFENYRKRVLKEKEETRQLATKQVMEDLLPVLDNFERAVGVDEPKGELGKFLQGVQMIYVQLMDVLKNNGLAVIDCVGKEFNPEVHQAVMKCKVNDGNDNTVLEEVQKGYFLNNKLIRPSMVKVSSRN